MDISTITDAFGDVMLMQPSAGVIVAAVLAAILLGMSAFASGSEIAFFSLSPTDVAELEDEKTDADKKIQMLRDDSERTLATILITNNFVNVTIIMLLNYVFAGIVEFGPKAYWLQFLIITVILTFLLLLFGEIMPKVYARQDPLKFCRRCVGGILFARKLFWPLETILLKRATDSLGRWIMSRSIQKPADTPNPATVHHGSQSRLPDSKPALAPIFSCWR